MAISPHLNIEIARKVLPNGEPLFAGLKLTIGPGEVVALVGPSGIGKTTLLRLIAGVERGYAGSIQVGDAVAHDAPAPGMMFQDPRLLPWLTVLGNLRLVAPRLDGRTAETALAELGLPGAGELYPDQLSLGMQRRVALLRALVAEPGLLLLDEPFASLDPERHKNVQAWLVRELERTRPTVVFATHEVGDAGRLADRVIALTGRPVVAHELAVAASPPAGRTAPEIEALTVSLRLALEAVHA